MQAKQVRAWRWEFERVNARIAECFGRSEPRARARAYLRGLLAPIERKNGWQLAEAAGDASPDGVQDFLARAHWDADAVRDELRGYVMEHLADPDAVLVLDETGFVKKGAKSAGVQRQYSGTAGRIENCQVGVFLAYAGPRGYAFIDRELYMPRDWVSDAARRRDAHVPQTLEFATKPELGAAMLARALAGGVPCAWVTADSVYGAPWRMRDAVARAGRGYVLGVTGAQHWRWLPRSSTVAQAADELPARAWVQASCGAGAKGPRRYEWAYLPAGFEGDAEDSGGRWERGLLVRRHRTRRAERAYYFTRAPVGTALETLVRVAGTRWTIESGFEQTKGEVGLDQYEVRRYDAWYRHITLALLAHAYLTALRASAIGSGKKNRPPAVANALGPHRAGDPPAAGRTRARAAHARGRRARVVAVATHPSATRHALPLGTATP